MKRKFFPLFVILIAVSLLIVAAGRPPFDEKHTLHEFTGKVTCQENTTWSDDKDWLDRWAVKHVVCSMNTDDPATSGTMDLTLVSLTHPKKAYEPGWGLYWGSLRNSYTDWDGWIWARFTPEGRSFSKGQGWASRGAGYYGNRIWWEFTDESPSIVHGWYGK